MCMNGFADKRFANSCRFIPSPKMGYSDQPQLLLGNASGEWICMVTLGYESEEMGSDTYVMRSCDHGHTWTKGQKCNGGYAVPFKTEYGRIYALSPQQFTYSDDGGQSFSNPITIEHNSGTGWAVGLPTVVGKKLYIPWATIEKGMRNSVVYMLVSENILDELDATKLTFRVIGGIKGPDWELDDHVSEEPHIAVLQNNRIYVGFRTDKGYICYSMSEDGQTFSPAKKMMYGPSNIPIKNPRACPSIWEIEKGKYLLWHHNHNGKNYDDRNPVWVCGGIEKDGDIAWSWPEILFYTHDLSYDSGRFSYPGIMEVDGKIYISETNKVRIGIHEMDFSGYEGMWDKTAQVSEEGLFVQLSKMEIEKQKTYAMPKIIRLDKPGSGLCVAIQFVANSTLPGQVIADTIYCGRGFRIKTAENASLRLTLQDGNTICHYSTDPNRIVPGKLHHMALIADGEARIFTAVTDGIFNDGGSHRQFGWGRFSSEIRNINGGPLSIAPSFDGTVHGIQIYSRYLMTWEAARLTENKE